MLSLTKSAILLGALTIGTSGWGQQASMIDDGPSIPSYDVTAHCQKDSRYVDEELCTNLEYAMRSQVRQSWAYIASDRQEECIKASQRWESYQTLLLCLR